VVGPADVTTVGSGDVTPKNPSGRIVASFVMLEGIALLSITIAAIASTFVARAQREREAIGDAAETEVDRRIEARLEGIDRRLDELARLIRAGTNS
jgi:voltage-gated potassium channel